MEGRVLTRQWELKAQLPLTEGPFDQRINSQMPHL